MNEVCIEDPSDDFLRLWASNPSRYHPMRQDWELLITTHARGPLFIEIINSEAEGREFFLDCLYLLTYKSIGDNQKEKKLHYLFYKVNEWTSNSDLVLWMKRSKWLVEKSKSPNFSLQKDCSYTDWRLGNK